MSSAATQALQVIKAHRLDERKGPFARYVRLLEHGWLDNDLSSYILRQAKRHVESLQDFPMLLHRCPRPDQWLNGCQPDLQLGSLVENTDLRFGIDLFVNPADSPANKQAAPSNSPTSRHTRILAPDEPISGGEGFGGGQHCGFIGTTGSGKTCGQLALLEQIFAWNHKHPDFPVRVFCKDSKSGNFIALAKKNVDQCLALSIRDGVQIGFNGPKNVPPPVWVRQVVAMCFGTRAELKASVVCLANMILWTLGAMNPSPNECLLWPSPNLLLDIAQRVPFECFASKPDYARSLIQKLETFEGLALFDTFRGLDLEEIFAQGKSVVLDTCGLSPPWVDLWVTDLLISQILSSRQMAFRKGRRVDTIIMIDEADAEVAQTAENQFAQGALSPLAKCQKQGREAGVALVLGISTLGPVARQILANMNNLFIFRTTDDASLVQAGNALLLPTGGAMMLPSLPSGQCLLRTNNGWPHAVLGQFDYVPGSTEGRPEQFDRVPYIPGRRLPELPGVEEQVKKFITEYERSKLRRFRERVEATLDDHAHRLLHASVTHPWWPVARLWEVVSAKLPNPQTQQGARESLEKAELAVFEQIRSCQRNVLTMWPTDKGCALVHHAPIPRPGGGVAHGHGIHCIAMVGVKRGLKVAVEYRMPGTNRQFDAAWFYPDGTIDVFEVAIHTTNLPGHVTGCFSAASPPRRMTIVCLQKSICREVAQLLRNHIEASRYLERVSFSVLDTFHREIWP